MEILQALSPFVPLLQTGLWVALGFGAFLWLRPQLRQLVDALTQRIEAGSSFKAGPLEVGELRKLDYVAPAEVEPPAQLAATPPKALPPGPQLAVDWATERDELYRACRGVFLAHLISPSEEPGQRFDIFIFLVRHKSDDFSDVDSAEFFFGHYWGNRVFREANEGGPIGVSTAAYGPFLCTCRVHFRDGHTALMSRYIDFEMERVLPSLEGPTNQLQRTRSAMARRRGPRR